LQKIALPAVVLEEKTSVRDIITAEQQHVLDAIAVRNMKTRKTMTHQVHDLFAPRCHFHTPAYGVAGLSVVVCFAIPPNIPAFVAPSLVLAK
jgi:hypothetical protein